MLNKREFTILLAVAIIISSHSVFAQNSDIDSLLLKVTLNKESGGTTRFMGVSSDEGGEFKLYVENVPGVKLSEDNFVLETFEKKQVGVEFSTEGLEPGIYVGSIAVENAREISKIPVIFEIESAEVLFDMNVEIPVQFREVKQGENIIAQVKIFDLTSASDTGLGPSRIKMDYYIYSLDGDALSSENEDLVVDRQATVTKSQALPFDIQEGDYIFIAVASYEKSIGIASSLFKVGVEAEPSPFYETSNFIFFIIIGAFMLFFLVGISFFSYLVHDRNKLVTEMQSYNKEALDKQRELILAQMKVLENKRPDDVKESKREVENKIFELKNKQNERLNEFKQLQKQGKIKELNERLAELKKKEQTNLLFESRIGGLSLKELRSIMNELKKIKELMANIKETANIKKINFQDISAQIRRLEYQKSLLEDAYAKGFVHKDSYLVGKTKLNSLIHHLKKRL